jgi:hypothetical protein
MINKYISVTKSVTEDSLEEMSTKGYDFYWDVAADGYEWCGKDSLAFDKDLNKRQFNLTLTGQDFRYDKDLLLYDFALSNIIPMNQAHPEPMDLQEPWLVEKGSLALRLKQNLEKTSRKAWKTVPTRQYRPLSTRTLHRRFASLNTESLETEVLSFANKYGLLGRAVGLMDLAVVEGESLHRWHKEIEKMGVLLAIWDLIRREEAGKLGQIILWRNSDCVEIRLKWRYQKGQYEFSKWDGQGKVAGFGHTSEIVENSELSPAFFNEYKRGDVIGPARYYLGKKVNHHLFGIRPKMVGFHEYEVTFIPITLLDALWLLFMLEVQGKTKVARCDYCGEWFELERSTKAYCNGNCRRLAFYHRKLRAKEAQHERPHNQEV